MHGSKGRRGSAARIIGWGLVAFVYAVVLVWAGALNGESALVAEQSAQAVAGAVVVAPVQEVDAAAVSAIPTPTEAPLVTVAIAMVMVAAAGGWHVLRTLRARHPHLRGARLIVRHLTTLL